ncbi:MAG TPA: hypothetical protein VHE81_08610 [Lacipirellulaceae bacterium]|nr:hypothetical protein [Lacipirellulaceae bacterium]
MSCRIRWSDSSCGRALLVVVSLLVFSTTAEAVYDYRFDLAVLCCNCGDKHFCSGQLDALNWVSTNGHVLAMGSDAYRSTVNGNGNFIAAYYDTLNDPGYLQKTATQKADDIHQYCVDRYTSTGVITTWIVLNEISAGTWPNNQTYRTWVHDVVHRLKNTYGHKIILFSPFQTVASNDSDWQAVSADAYIGIECYLSGEELRQDGRSSIAQMQAWAETQYQASKNSYLNRGVSSTKLFIGEHYGQTVSGTGWGRAGTTTSTWTNCIRARCRAIKNVGFAGSISYGWGDNAMGTGDSYLIQFEQTYASEPMLSTE